MVNLTIGGGSFKGLSYIGALEYLYNNNLINKIDNFYGTSIGTIIGTLFIIGFKPFEILKVMLNLNLEECWDLNFEYINKTYSLLSDTFFIKIKDIFSTKENCNITFLEFYNKYNINLNFYACSLTKRKNICFSKIEYPNVKILTIIQASCSIPILFPPVKFNDDYLMDGCIKNIDGLCKEILNDNKINFIIKGDYSYNDIKNFQDYVISLINCSTQNEEEINTDYTIKVKSMEQYENKINFNDINYSNKIQLYYHGIQIAKNKLENNIENIILKINQEILNEHSTNINDKNISNDNYSNDNYSNVNDKNDNSKKSISTQTDCL